MLRDEQKGSAAMMAIFLMATLLAMVLTSFVLLQANNKVNGRQLTFYGQAGNAAQAGLVETLTWFRNQTTQPVTAFSPQRNLAANPPVNETDDASIGIVRDYEISGPSRTWGRYEVRLANVVDVTAKRGKTGTGIVWQVQSTGYVYVKNDDTKAFNQAPNKIIAQQTAQTEFQRLSMVLPGGNAGINSDRGDRVTLSTRARVFAGTSYIGISYKSSTGTPSICSYPCQVTGSPSQSQVNPYDASIAAVFGLQTQELTGMADIVGSSEADLPNPLPDMSLVVVNGNATFSASRPLSGSGVLVVLGNLTVNANSYSSYNGLVYVTGSYTQNAPSQVSGSLIGKGTIQLVGTGDFAEISYDRSMLQTVQQQMGQYRISRAITFGTSWR